MLPDNHPEKINNLSGINDPYEIPQNADLTIHTHLESEGESVETLFEFIIKRIQN
jgi:adenylylsulfate kinase-like enzyme